MSMHADLPYYNFDRALSYNAIINMIVSGRGMGKTYGAKVRAVSRALKKDEHFILLRRYKDEITSAKPTFFSDIESEFPEYLFRINGNNAEASLIPEKVENKKGELIDAKPEWFVIGYFVVLSAGQSKKGTSYHKVRTIIFDEFILEKGMVHYIPNEVMALLNFYSTVDRNRNKCRLIMLANAVTMTNPYFLEWNIKPDVIDEYSTHYDGFIMVHLVKSGAFGDAVMKTRFGKFIANSEYAKYAVANNFKDSNAEMVKRKPGEARYKYSIETDVLTYSVWYEPDEGNYFIQQKRPKNEIIYTTDRDNMASHKRFMERNHRFATTLRNHFNSGRMYFDEPSTRNTFINIFKQ